MHFLTNHTNIVVNLFYRISQQYYGDEKKNLRINIMQHLLFVSLSK
jgi:hypothetical protein